MVPDYLWKDRKTGQQIELIPGKEQFEVEICSDTPDPVLLASYSADGTLTDGNTSVEEEQGYLTKLCSLLFQSESAGLPRAELLYETDGAGNNAVHAEKLSQPEKIKKKLRTQHGRNAATAGNAAGGRLAGPDRSGGSSIRWSGIYRPQCIVKGAS